MSELPIQTALLELATGALLARSGGTRGWRGKLGIAAHAASLAGLVALHRKARDTGAILEAALTDELGADYRSRIREPFSPQPEVALTRRQLFMPDMRTRKRYRTARDIAYGDAGVRNHLDVWKRSDLPGRRRGAGALPGARWRLDGRAEGRARRAADGAPRRARVGVRHRELPAVADAPPGPTSSSMSRRRWRGPRRPSGSTAVIPTSSSITGGSAGGHLASLAALTPHVTDFQPGFEDADTSVVAAVPFYGVYDFVNRHGTDRADIEGFLAKTVFKSQLADDRARWEQASTISHVGPHAPPFFVLHGTNDSLVPVEQARAFVDELRKARSSRSSTPSSPARSTRSRSCRRSARTPPSHAVERFLAVVRSEHGGRTPAEAVDENVVAT